MTITFELSAQDQQKLEEVSAANGYSDVGEYVRSLVEKKVQEAKRASLQHEFRRLADEWRRAQCAASTAKRMAEHPAYRKIVNMGKDVVPCILAELEQHPDHWFFALREITGATPVPEKSRGNVKEMAEAWLDWGRKQGYHW